MKESDFLLSNVNIPNYIDCLLSNHKKRKEHPDWLELNGIICFCGEQGSGKTLSAVQYLRRVCQRYPKAKVVSNIDIQIPDIDNKFYYYEGLEMMMQFNNGENGVIFFIDEMHLEFNSLESKGMDIRTFELVSQQRKARKHIIGTSQVFGRLAKPFREQFKYAVLCERYLGYLFKQEIYRAKSVPFEDDIRVELRQQGTAWYIPSLDMFDMYDTSEIIKRVNNGFRST